MPLIKCTAPWLYNMLLPKAKQSANACACRAICSGSKFWVIHRCYAGSKCPEPSRASRIDAHLVMFCALTVWPLQSWEGHHGGKAVALPQDYLCLLGRTSFACRRGDFWPNIGIVYHVWRTHNTCIATYQKRCTWSQQKDKVNAN